MCCLLHFVHSLLVHSSAKNIETCSVQFVKKFSSILFFLHTFSFLVAFFLLPRERINFLFAYLQIGEPKIYWWLWYIVLRIVVGLDSGCVRSWLLLTCQNLCQSHYFGAWHQHWPTKTKIGFTKDFCRGDCTFIFEPLKMINFHLI